MNTITSILLIGLCLTGALASPVAPKEATEGETRTIYNSGGGIYLGLNSTILWVAVAGLLVGAIIIYAGASSGLLDDTQSYGYQQRYDQYHQQQEQPYRTKRSYDESKSILICIDNRKRLMLLFDVLMVIPFSIKLEKNLYITCKLD